MPSSSCPPAWGSGTIHTATAMFMCLVSCGPDRPAIDWTRNQGPHDGPQRMVQPMFLVPGAPGSGHTSDMGSSET